MHQTTVRFGADLWSQLEDEAARTGVSTAQYIRDAALTRLAYTAGQRGDREYEAALAQVTEARRALAGAHDAVEGSEALWAQGRLARERARALRARSASATN
jgi:hypothetical protein